MFPEETVRADLEVQFMDDNDPQNAEGRTPSARLFHALNNQLQMLLVSTEKLQNTAHDFETQKQCSAIDVAAHRIVELLSLLARQGADESLPEIEDQITPEIRQLFRNHEHQAGT